MRALGCVERFIGHIFSCPCKRFIDQQSINIQLARYQPNTIKMRRTRSKLLRNLACMLESTLRQIRSAKAETEDKTWHLTWSHDQSVLCIHWYFTRCQNVLLISPSTSRLRNECFRSNSRLNLWMQVKGRRCISTGIANVGGVNIPGWCKTHAQ